MSSARSAALLPWLRLAAFVLLVLALARPQTQAAVEQDAGQGIDIMLTMDISGSMLAEDFEPKNRFVVAQETLERFANETQNDRLGLVIFARQAFTQCPLTLDHEMVAQLIRQVQQGMIDDGTAVGMAIATAAHRLRESKAKSKVIILMTDGMNNSGKIDPLTAAKAAAALGIRIYAIGVGKEGGAPIPLYRGVLGKQYDRNPDGTLKLTEVDEETLKKVAATTGEVLPRDRCRCAGPHLLTSGRWRRAVSRSEAAPVEQFALPGRACFSSCCNSCWAAPRQKAVVGPQTPALC